MIFLVNLQLKAQLPLDGTNIMEELLGVSEESSGYLGRRRPIIYYCNTKLMAIRIGNIKVIPIPYSQFLHKFRN